MSSPFSFGVRRAACGVLSSLLARQISALERDLHALRAFKETFGSHVAKTQALELAVADLEETVSMPRAFSTR